MRAKSGLKVASPRFGRTALPAGSHHPSSPHVVGIAVFAILVAVVFGGAVTSIVSPRLRHTIPKAVGYMVAGVAAIYLVGRGIAEFWVVNFSDPASYRHSWGGPSLVGVFAVHTGPGLAVVIAGVVWLRHLRAKRAGVTPIRPPGPVREAR